MNMHIFTRLVSAEYLNQYKLHFCVCNGKPFYLLLCDIRRIVGSRQHAEQTTNNNFFGIFCETVGGGWAGGGVDPRL